MIDAAALERAVRAVDAEEIIETIAKAMHRAVVTDNRRNGEYWPVLGWTQLADRHRSEYRLMAKAALMELSRIAVLDALDAAEGTL